MNLSQKSRETLIGYLLMAIILYLVFFLRLSSFHIRTWDESTYAVNAYEMLHHGNFFVPYHNGQIDTHAKPVLAIWLEVLSAAIFGFDELSVRLPSAIAGVLACLILFFFVKKNFGLLQAWCSLLVLSTSLGYTNFHATRTGDMDSLLVLFLLLSNISFFNYFADDKSADKHLFLWLLFLALAFLTKSVAAFVFLPAYVLLILSYRKSVDIIKRPGFYFGLAALLLLAGGYLFIREKAGPGYFKLLQTDLLRTSQAIENHSEPFDFYFNNFVSFRFSAWVLLFVVGCVLGFKSAGKDAKVRLFFIWALSLAVVFIAIISFSSTKLEWYDLPVYPYLSLIAGYAVSEIVQSLNNKRIVAIAVIFCVPLYYSIKQSDDSKIPNANKAEERLSDYLYTREMPGVNMNGWKIANTLYDAPLLFYKYKLKDKGQEISIIRPENIKEREKVIAAEDSVKNFIRKNFNYTVTDSFHEVIVYQLKDRRQLTSPVQNP